MQDITEIMNMLDWHKLPEIQTKGIAQAKDAETIRPFIQPLTPEHNKNVWENCAVIIAEKSDEKLIIPMAPRSESLNAAVAASVIMWEMSRG